MSDNDPCGKNEIEEASHKAMVKHLNGTPNEQLRELAREWKKAARGGTDKDGRTVLLTCADELETLLENE